MAVVSLAGRAGAQVPGDTLGRAMHDELTRSMQLLHTDQLERPYFISYTVHDIQSLTMSASNGSLRGRDSSHRRALSVEVRVGDYKFDNTNFLNMPNIGLNVEFAEEFMRGLQLPLEDNYLELRRQMWLATDATYKRAAEALVAKRAALMNQSRTDSLPDFTREAVNHAIDETRAVPFKTGDLESLVREASNVRSLTDMFASGVTANVTIPRTRYLNSEGTTYTRLHPWITLTATASTQADDGMPLSASIQFRSTSLGGLPARAQILAAIGTMCERLDSLRHAPLIDRYNGPVLFEGRAAAELFSEAFVPSLVGRRRMTMSNPEMGMGFDRVSDMLGGTSFADKLGGRVLPDFLSVVDDPTILSLAGYKVDEEGVAARRTQLVDGGILKTLLTTRTPVQGVDHSTGNRRGGMAAPSNLIVTADRTSSEEQLVAQLLTMVQKRGLPYGIIVREVGGSTSAASAAEAMSMMQDMVRPGGRERGARFVYRVYPDGRLQMVRGARISGLTVEAFKDIVAAGKTPTLDYRAGSDMQGGMAMLAAFTSGGGLPSGTGTISSFSVPSLLFDDMTFVHPTGTLPSLPFSAPPGR
jgi:predicted Zn-dependent protease